MKYFRNEVKQQTNTGLAEVVPKGREGTSSLNREHCMTLCLIFGCKTLWQDSQGIGVQGEAGAEWIKKRESSGLHDFIGRCSGSKMEAEI